jgi:hypothetical protein
MAAQALATTRDQRRRRGVLARFAVMARPSSRWTSASAPSDRGRWPTPAAGAARHAGARTSRTAPVAAGCSATMCPGRTARARPNPPHTGSGNGRLGVLLRRQRGAPPRASLFRSVIRPTAVVERARWCPPRTPSCLTPAFASGASSMARTGVGAASSADVGPSGCTRPRRRRGDRRRDRHPTRARRAATRAARRPCGGRAPASGERAQRVDPRAV